jgi:hypothetical protein
MIVGGGKGRDADGGSLLKARKLETRIAWRKDAWA